LSDAITSEDLANPGEGKAGLFDRSSKPNRLTQVSTDGGFY
jgi:hypothetical protein